MISIRFSTLFTALLLVSKFSFAQVQVLDSAWIEFINNKPFEAKELFRRAAASKSPEIAAEAYRGLGNVESFLGYNNVSGLYFIDAYRKDKNLLMFSARPDFQLSESNFGKNRDNKEDILLKLASSSGLFNGWYQDALLQRYLNEGQLKKATKLRNKMGAITDWQFIGPFENISNCGLARKYPPELERKYNKEYEGKNGNTVVWHKLKALTPNAWIFTDNHGTEENSVYYFNCGINSPANQEVYLSFGASGTFQVFLNGNTVLIDTVFRNTGIDAYMQKVKLNKGDNDLLVKIGHETVNAGGSLSGYANFLLRFLDNSYLPLTNIKVLQNVTSYRTDTASFQNMSPSPVLDSISSVLTKVLRNDSTCFDALFSLVSLYNVYERTNDAQLIVQKYLKKYPNSSILYSLLAESFIRAKKNTEYEIAMKRAFDLCNLNRSAWARQLRLNMERENFRSVIDFLNNSPDEFRKSAAAVIAYLTAAIQQKNSSETLNRITELETFYADNPEVMNILLGYYVSQGILHKASSLLQKYTDNHHMATDVYSQIAEIEIKQGNIKKGIDNFLKAISFNPSEPASYLRLSNLHFNKKEYSEALSYVDQCLGIIPTSSIALNLKGNILASMGKKDEAIQTFLNTVKYTSDDFTAWESIRMLKSQKSFEQMTPLPNVDSLIKLSSQWLKSVPGKAALLSFIEDVYLYPSRSSSSRVFLVLHLPNQNEIDQWKEYHIPYNPTYQQLHVERAVSRKIDGSEISADYRNNFIVFKSLEPGDCIVLEYSLKNYYEGVMAGKIYGSQDFHRGIPSFDTRLRLISPENDSIPYRIIGDSITVVTDRDQDYRITSIRAMPFTTDNQEAFCPTDFSSYSKAIYSNFNNWEQISDWYYELSRHKQNQTIELKTLADSLFANTQSEWEKAKRIHEFITKNINYSFVSFRQSGWVPQAAKDVLATRIGDCKDMASLGKCLMDIAGIKSWLVLVNTGLRHFTDHAFIGPNFDHCILQFIADGKTDYVDFTDRNTSLGRLPSSDQGAMALVIRPENNQIIRLPVDSPDNRAINRQVNMELDSNGTLKLSMETMRSGVFASQIRASYRFQNETERRADLHRAVSSDYPDVKLDSLWFDNLDSINDSIRFNYYLTAKNAADINGTTIIYSLRLPDALGSGYFPVEHDRKNPVDISFSAAGIVKMEMVANLLVPKEWKLMDIPQNDTLNTDNMSYRLSFKIENGRITVYRNLACNYNRIFSKEEFAVEQEALMKVTKSDDVKLIFKKK